MADIMWLFTHVSGHVVGISEVVLSVGKAYLVCKSLMNPIIPSSGRCNAPSSLGMFFSLLMFIIAASWELIFTKSVPVSLLVSLDLLVVKMVDIKINYKVW